MKLTIRIIGFLQALGLIIYCSLVGLLFLIGDSVFGPANNFLGPIMGMVLFVTSALICGLICFSYPIYLIYEKKNSPDAIRTLIFTAVWLLIAFLVILIALMFV